jgi:Coenzyme F420-dependent N5,N10-methylene tetrahydromethanopterin reductase and related flavin-dependent oxidoreductases
MANHLPCGIELPQVFFDGPVDMEHIRKFATRAETLGYDSLWLQERIVGDITMLEPVTLLSYVAAITAKLKLGTSVILLPLRNPVQLAKAYSTPDVMSNGRAIMGVGWAAAIWAPMKNVFGYSREGRVTRFTEAVQIIKLLWTEPKASFQGRYWNFKDVSMDPSRCRSRTCRSSSAATMRTPCVARLNTLTAGWARARHRPDRLSVSRRGFATCLPKPGATRRRSISPNASIWLSITMKRAASGAFASGSAAAIKMPISVPKFRSGAAPASVPKKSKRSSKPGRSKSFSIRCSTRWSIWKSARRRSCRICEGSSLVKTTGP